MSSTVNLSNVGWRAFIDNVVKLPGFPQTNNGATTMKATLDQLAANSNDFTDRIAALEDAVSKRPFS